MDEKFNARFGWFWYNDEEILFSSQEDIDRKIENHSRQGITHLITFSSTHFRWSFRKFWPEINECIRKICVAGHKYGIKIIEHHSSHLGHFPDTENRLAAFNGEMTLRCSDAKNYPGIVEDMLDKDNIIESWCQISGSTGTPVITYDGHGRCFNNPRYREMYLQYLESVYACGVDGIMTDDVQYYGDSCVCPHCRRLFLEKYGYELPSSEQWEAWYGNWKDPSFAAWRKFRVESLMDFHKMVAEHYTSLGLKMLRPNYTSIALCPGRTGYILEDLPALDWTFQECCYSTIIRYTWPLYMLDQLHRRMVEKKRSIPSMMMFYADRKDQLDFSWGVARLCGALYTNTPEGRSTVDETQIRNFEKKYASYLFNCDNMPCIGFIDSVSNRRFGYGYESSRMKFWIQSCFYENIPVELMDIAMPEIWKNVPVLCVNEVHILSDKETASLLEYAENGGTLIVTGSSGRQDENFADRTEEERNALWGRPHTVGARELLTVQKGKGKVLFAGWRIGYPGTEEELDRMFLTDFDTFDKEMEVYALRKDIPEIWLSRAFGKNVNKTMKNNTNFFKGMASRAEVKNLLLKELEGKMTFRVEKLPALVLASPLVNRDTGNISIQLLNAAETMKEGEEERIAHEDPIPFPAHTGEACFTLLLPAGKTVKKVFFASPEKEETPLSFRLEGNSVTIPFPLELLKTNGAVFLA